MVDDEYPIWLTTGRVVSQYLSGTQTRRIAGLVDQYPEPLCEMHPRLAERLGVAEGDRVTVTSRRGEMTLPAHVVTTIRPDTVFIPYHWPGAQAANQLTNRAVDPARRCPSSRWPPCASPRPAVGPPPPMPATLDLTEGHAMTYTSDDAPIFVIDQSRCIGCEACVQACMECGTHRGQSLIHLEHVDPASTTQTAPMVCMHCEDPTCAQVCPADAIKQTEDGIVQSALKPRCIGCSNCVIACPFGVPKYMAELDQMMKCDMCTDRTSEGLKPMCASVCPSQALWYGTIDEYNDTRRGSLLRDFFFGRQEVRTKVYTVVDDLSGGPLDVMAWPRAVLARRPLRPRRGATVSADTPAPLWQRDFPYQAAAEEEVTRREFTRYLVLGAGAMAAGNVGLAAWTQLRSINTGEPRPIVALADVAVGETYLFRYPTTTTRPCSCVSTSRPSWRSARSAPTSGASSTSRPRPTAGTARATRATSRPPPAR